MTGRGDPEFERERRKQRRLGQVGGNNWRCLICGDHRWPAIERHHVAGKIKGKPLHDFTWGFCSSCHDDIWEDQRLLPAPKSHPPSLRYRAGCYLAGRSFEFARIAHYIDELARRPAIAAPDTKLVAVDRHYLLELARYFRANGDANSELGLRLIAQDAKQSGRRIAN